jgi:ketosteroid isomerase-like protein
LDKGVSAKDVDRVMELYTDDVVAYDVVPPLQYVGKAAYRADYQQFFSQYESDLHVETRDLHVGTTGELGYATGLQMISGMLKHGQKSDVWVRFTSLYRKINGKWLDFHDHVSVPVEYRIRQSTAGPETVARRGTRQGLRPDRNAIRRE